jgi:mevalonate kinase
MKLIARASAPVKVILSGEHGVVHGTPAITLTLEPLNVVELFEEDGVPALVVESKLGRFTLGANGEIIEGENGHYERSLAAMVRHMMESHGFTPKKRLVAKIKITGAPKGMGSSSSIAAALASTLFHAMGKKPKRGKMPEQDELWLAVQSCDEVAHGGRPSGIDAYSVCYGPTKLQKLIVGDRSTWKFEEKNAQLPAGTKLVVVDTFKGERAATGDMIRTFAKANGLLNRKGDVKALLDLDAQDKKKLARFEKAFDEVLKHLNKKGDARALGQAMKENHLLLSQSGVSTKEIDEVMAISEKTGAYGAKLTGAGGKGGAVIILAPEKDEQLLKALKSAGYEVFSARPSARGAKLEHAGIIAERHSK